MSKPPNDSAATGHPGNVVGARLCDVVGGAERTGDSPGDVPYDSAGGRVRQGYSADDGEADLRGQVGTV
ncbi:MAG: hypothetical protein ABI251_07980 [Mycobacteriaceae bacterium]